MVTKTFRGHVTGAEFVQSAVKIAEAQEFDGLQFVISDLRHVSSYKIDDDTLTDESAIRIGSTNTNPNIRYVSIARDKELFSLLSKTRIPPLDLAPKLYLFSTEEDAWSWIKIQPLLFLNRR